MSVRGLFLAGITHRQKNQWRFLITTDSPLLAEQISTQSVKKLAQHKTESDACGAGVWRIGRVQGYDCLKLWKDYRCKCASIRS